MLEIACEASGKANGGPRASPGRTRGKRLHKESEERGDVTVIVIDSLPGKYFPEL